MHLVGIKISDYIKQSLGVESDVQFAWWGGGLGGDTVSL
jgi:hypothetical protein